jgi:hypothetical protein
MLFNKKGLLFAGLAAYAYYRYTRMPKEEKEALREKIKEKGKKIYDQYVPDSVKDLMGHKEAAPAATSAEPNYYV